MRWLLLSFIIIPLIEMVLLFEVAGQIGGLWTVALVVLTAVIGIRILRQQGLRTLWRARSRLEAGELPAREIVEAMLLAAAGTMLVTPGFITDTLGFAFLTPGLRVPLAEWLIARRIGVIEPGQGADFRSRSRNQANGTIYEGECSRSSPESSRIDDRRDLDE